MYRPCDCDVVPLLHELPWDRQGDWLQRFVARVMGHVGDHHVGLVDEGRLQSLNVEVMQDVTPPVVAHGLGDDHVDELVLVRRLGPDLPYAIADLGARVVVLEAAVDLLSEMFPVRLQELD
jgi:hypothetical protein